MRVSMTSVRVFCLHVAVFTGTSTKAARISPHILSHPFQPSPFQHESLRIMIMGS
jgi:hypothetical protein